MKNKNDSYPSSILIVTKGENIYEGFINLHFIKALKEAYPSAQIFWYTYGASVYSNTLKSLSDPFLDKVFEKTFLFHLWKYKFDFIIDTEESFFRLCALKLLRHHKIESNSFKSIFSSDGSPGFQEKHRLKKLMALASRLGRPLSFVGKRLPLPVEHRERARQILVPNQKYIGIVVGAGQPFKRWPLENFISLASFFDKKGYAPVFILGPQEKDLQFQIKEKIPTALFPLQDSRAFSSHIFTVAIGECLEVAVANDGGIGHLMSAAQIPLVSLYGKTDPDINHPLVEKGCIMKAQSYGSNEISAIPVKDVVTAIDQLVADKK